MPDPEAPEADLLEQQIPVTRTPTPDTPTVGIETPEADALEQAHPVVIDDEDENR